jgi:hypothetical protein
VYEIISDITYSRRLLSQAAEFLEVNALDSDFMKCKRLNFVGGPIPMHKPQFV